MSQPEPKFGRWTRAVKPLTRPKLKPNVKAKINRINDGFANGALEIQKFKELKNPLVPQKADLEQKLVEIERVATSPIEPLKYLVLEANQAQKWVL
jgi:hypothetical protein